MRIFLKTVGQILATILLGVILLFGYWYLRPNRAQVNKEVIVETWDIANDDAHNSNTDMIEWQGQFYLSYVSSPYHFGNDASVMHMGRNEHLQPGE